MSPTHLSVVDLDLAAFGSPSMPGDPRVLHLAECTECQTALAELKEERERFARLRLPALLPDAVVRSRPTPMRWFRGLADGIRWQVVLPGMALSALLAVVLPRVLAPQPAKLGIKGGAALRVFAHRGETTFQVEPGARLRRGDQLRFEIEGGGWPFLLVASVDGFGHVAVLYPSEGSDSLAIERPGPVLLPDAIELDEATGPERVFAVLSRHPLQASSLSDALAPLGHQGPQAIRATTELNLAGAGHVLSLEWEKEMP
jgi:hypothetical protein